MVGLMGLVATAATSLSTVAAVVTRATARKQRAKAEAAAKAAEALTAELLGHEPTMQVFLGGTTALSLASVVGLCQAKKRINELDLGSQIRDLRAHALSGRLANQERQSAIRVAGLQDALESSRVQAIRAAEVHRQVVERCHRERVAGESQLSRERAAWESDLRSQRAAWVSELRQERVAVQRGEKEAAAARRGLEKAQRRADEAVELRRKHAAVQQENKAAAAQREVERARQGADAAVELRQERAAVQRAENKAAAAERKVDKARRRADEAVDAAEAWRKDRAATAVQVSELRRKLHASEEAEKRSRQRISQLQQQHSGEVSELQQKLLASEEAQKRSQERIVQVQQQHILELSEQNLKLDRLPPLLIPETGFLDKISAGVEGCTAYVRGVVVLHRGDGNCKFSSEMDSALMVAAQDPTKLKELEGKVAVATSTSTFKDLQPEAKNHVKSFADFVKSLGEWWKGYSGEREHVGAWLAAEALSALAHEEEGARGLASGRLDAKLAESVSTQVVREARGRFERVVKRSDYQSLYKGAVMTARICEMVHLQDESRPTELVDQARHVNRFYDFDPYAWIPGDSLSVPVGFLGEGWNARRKAISFTAYDAVGDENADKTVQVFKREGWHFDVLVDDDSLLAGMITARNKLAAPHDPDVFRKEMEKAHGVRQETAGDEALAAKLAAEMMDGGGASYAEREQAAFAEFSGGRQSEQPADVGGGRMAGGGPDGNANGTGSEVRRTNGRGKVKGQAAAAAVAEKKIVTTKNAGGNANTNTNATARTTGGRGRGRGGGKGGGGRGARSRRRK